MGLRLCQSPQPPLNMPQCLRALLCCLLLSSSVSSLPTSGQDRAGVCEQLTAVIQPDILQNNRGELKCIEQDNQNRCEDILKKPSDFRCGDGNSCGDRERTPIATELRRSQRNQTVSTTSCLSPGSSCLGCRDQKQDSTLEAVCSQVYREELLFVLDKNQKDYVQDTFLIPDGCFCKKIKRI